MRGRHSNPRGRRRGVAVFSAAAFILASLVIAPPAFANHPGPASGDGIQPVFSALTNPTCADLTTDPNVQEFSIDPNIGGPSYTDIGSGLTINLTLSTEANGAPDGPVFAWTSSFPIDSIVVKGGPNGNHYIYPSGDSGDTALHAPVNHAGQADTYYGLSHISFCWVPRPSTDLTLNAASPTSLTIHSGDSVDLTFAEENDGNQSLTSPSVTADNGCTPAGVDADTDTFNDGDTDEDGVLDTGETWLFKCTVTNITSDTTITAIGHGTFGGKDVTYCTDPASPPANTTCDQDERTLVNVDVINPSTTLGLQSSNPSNLTIHSGDSVTLTFSEANDAVDGSVLNNPSVSADNGCSPAGVDADTDTFNDGDTNADGKLDPGETWLFSCTVTNITADTTITAIAHGIDATGSDVTWCTAAELLDPGTKFCDQDEIEIVNIDVVNPSTILSLSGATSPIGVVSGGNVTITFAEANDAVDGSVLENPSVEADNGCTPAGVDADTDTFNDGDTNEDGKLDPGETWLFSCTLTNVTSPVTITAIAHGTDSTGSDVTWCTAAELLNPGTKFCDQDEIEVVQVNVTFEGCTPGYWKQSQHLDSWTATGFSPNQAVGTVFSSAGDYTNTTLLQALGLKGGKNLNGARQILLRAAVAALLNASHPDITYPMTQADVIAAVNAALASNNRTTMLTLAAQLDALNNGGCPLN